jgi:ribonucleoside-diphosphate reductase alpha chain
MTNDPDIRFASSIVDYVFRRLALDHLTWEQREALGIRSIQERTEEAEEKIAQLDAGSVPEPPPTVQPIEQATVQPIEQVERPTARVLDAPLCYQCGSKMQPAGSCYVCGTCGSTSGCS